jgi:hypothetical protein
MAAPKDPTQVGVHVDEVHIHIHNDPAATEDPRIKQILALLTALTKGVRTMAANLDDLTSEVERNTSVDQSAITLLEGLKAQLDAAGTDPAALQALKDSLAASSDALAAAVAANTPAAG